MDKIANQWYRIRWIILRCSTFG